MRFALREEKNHFFFVGWPAGRRRLDRAPTSNKLTGVVTASDPIIESRQRLSGCGRLKKSAWPSGRTSFVRDLSVLRFDTMLAGAAAQKSPHRLPGARLPTRTSAMSAVI